MILAALCFAPRVLAAPATSQSYTLKGTVVTGTVVSLTQDNFLAIEAAKPENTERLLGVVVDPSDSLVAFTNANSDSRVQVVSTGAVYTQVSTVNGDIKTGDALCPSPISGVAMKATRSGKIIGIAQKDFSTVADTKEVTITDTKGMNTNVKVGKLLVQVTVQDWHAPGVPNSQVLNDLRSVLANATGRPVSNAQAVIAISIVVMAMLISGIILYSAVSASIHSIGRNPLSKGIVRRSLIVMVALVGLILVGACSAVYLILRG